MPPLAAVLDTCVLVPFAVRDTLLSAAEAGFYSPAWSIAILTELERTLREEPFDLKDGQVRHLLATMQRAFPEAMVTAFEQLAGQLTIDPKDRHVLAAAIKVGATSIVTDNIRHFPPTALGLFGVEAQTPDAFLATFAREDVERVVWFLTRQAAAMRQPPTDLAGLLAQLERRVPEFVRQVRQGTGRQ
jgi:predicted nucleic acid-binding protein